MRNIPVQDSRRYFLLPQGFEGGGYYAYGSPGGGHIQFAHPSMITLICGVAARWALLDTRKFGVGDISLANGLRHPDHKTHRSGLEVDIRPLRLDGKHLPCSIHDRAYDQEGSAKLIRLFFCTANVAKILFNDQSIPRVIRAAGHDNHFHVSLRLKG